MVEASKVTVQIKNETGVLEKQFCFDSTSQFRLIFFDAGGQPRSHGGLPLNVVRRPLRRWAADWAEAQDVGKLETIINKHGCRLSVQELLRALSEAELGDTLGKEVRAKRGDIVAFHVVREIAKALVLHCKRLVARPVTTWQFAQFQPDERDRSQVLEWLFRR